MEVFSNKNGEIRIDGFWGLYLFSDKPRLTVYKPGYVVWDNQEICPSYEKRNGFKKKSNLIRLKKFNTEYPKWLKEFSHIKYPFNHHQSFLSHCVDGEVYDKYTKDQISIEDIFYKYNRQYLRNEDKEIFNNRN